MLVISSDQSFTSQILKVVGLLSEKFDFLFPWDLKFKVLLITKPGQKPQKSSFAQAELQKDI